MGKEESETILGISVLEIKTTYSFFPIHRLGTHSFNKFLMSFYCEQGIQKQDASMCCAVACDCLEPGEHFSLPIIYMYYI